MGPCIQPTFSDSSLSFPCPLQQVESEWRELVALKRHAALGGGGGGARGRQQVRAVDQVLAHEQERVDDLVALRLANATPTRRRRRREEKTKMKNNNHTQQTEPPTAGATVAGGNKDNRSNMLKLRERQKEQQAFGEKIDEDLLKIRKSITSTMEVHLHLSMGIEVHLHLSVGIEVHLHLSNGIEVQLHLSKGIEVQLHLSKGIEVHLHLSLSAQVTVHIKEDLQWIQAENQAKRAQLAHWEGLVAQKRDLLTDAKWQRKRLRSHALELKQRCGMLGNVVLLRDFEDQTDACGHLEGEAGGLQRRHSDTTLKCACWRKKLGRS